MEHYDWSRFVTRININAPEEKLYLAWTTRSGIESWFLRRSEFREPDGSLRGDEEPVQEGDSYTWWWHGYPDSVFETGTILSANGKNAFSFRFGKAGICRVSIREEKGERIVELVQEEIPTDEVSMKNYHLGCKTGWVFYLANLKSILEGGIDLRNRNEQLQEMLNS